MKKLKVIIPVYNEEEAVGEVLQDWFFELSKLNIDYEIHAYDDGSKDKSLKILQQIEKENKTLKVHVKENSGHGPTILKGYQDNLDAEWLFQVDSDNELKARYFAQFWNQREDYDFLIGYRKNRDSPFARIVITEISRLVVNTFYGSNIKDVNTPYRLMRVKAFEQLIPNIPKTTFAPNLILSGLSNLEKMKIKQFAVPHQTRETGEVSIKKWKLLKVALKSFAQTIIYRFK